MSASLPSLRGVHPPRNTHHPERAPASRRWGPAWPGQSLHQHYATMGGGGADGSKGGAGGGSSSGVIKISRGRPVVRVGGAKQGCGEANGAEFWAHSSLESTGARNFSLAGVRGGGGSGSRQEVQGASKRPWPPIPHSISATPHEAQSSLPVPPGSPSSLPSSRGQATRPSSVVDSSSYSTCTATTSTATSTLLGPNRPHSPLPPVPSGQPGYHDYVYDEEEGEPSWCTRPTSSPLGSTGTFGSMPAVLLPLSSVGSSRATTPIQAVRLIAPKPRPRTVPGRT